MAEICDVGSYDFLKKGRKPYASARLCGCGDTTIRGILSFYDTPLGILVCAEVEGMSSSEGVYGFCLGGSEKDGYKEREDACLRLPLIYTKHGRGRAALVSEGLRRISLNGRCVFLKESRFAPLCACGTLACGIIEGG